MFGTRIRGIAMTFVRMNRRAFLAASAAAAALPVFSGEAFAAIDTNEWHDKDEGTHLSMRNTAYGQNYRDLSLSMHGDPASPHYTSVMFKPAGAPLDTQIVPSLSWNDLKSKYATLAKASPAWAPYIVTATGPRANAKFTAVFVKTPIPALLWADMTPDDLHGKNSGALGANLIPISIEAYGTDNDPRYCAVWMPNFNANLDVSQWCVDAINEEVAIVQQRFNAMITVGGRSNTLSITPGGRYLHGFVDGNVGAWFARGDMTTDKYEAALAEMKGKGLKPVRVAAKSIGGQMRYAAIFGGTLDVDKRTTRQAGLNPGDAIPEIDSHVFDYMAGHGIRGAALAITSGTRLVYAQGYTRAEQNYGHDITPATCFRLASCSKTFAAVAAWRLMQQDSSFTLDTKLQAILGTSPFSGSVGSGFANVTIRDLLEMTSGIDPGLEFASPQAAKAAGHDVPAKPKELERYISGFDCAPQNPVAVYCNPGYVLLGDAIAKKLNVGSFEDALTQLVLTPLGNGKMTVRGAISLLASQKNDEARYHYLRSDVNVRTAGAPLCPANYGGWDYEIFDGAGGLSASVIDVARLMAMFSASKDTACLSVNSINAMINAGLSATQKLAKTGKEAHGFHGFDGVDDQSVPGLKIASKGGWVEGAQSFLTFARGSLGITMLINTNERTDPQAPSWLDQVTGAAVQKELGGAWKSVDLFNQLGFPQLPPSMAPQMKSFKVPKQLSPVGVFQLQRNALARARRPLKPR